MEPWQTDGKLVHMSGFRRIGRYSAALALLGVSLAGCAAPPPPPPVASAPAPRTAMVLTVRPLDAALPLPDTLATILPVGTTHPPAGLAEMILRTGDGDVISVVEPLPTGLAAGQRVILRNGMAVLPGTPQG